MILRVFLLCVALANPVFAQLKPNNLRCEYLIDPLGIDVTGPRLSWTFEPSKSQNLKQSAYQVQVWSKPGRAMLWDSGKVDSDETIHIEYCGKPLESRMRCGWHVRVWDGDGKVSDWSERPEWTMGLLSPTDWKAKWIGSPRDPGPPAALPATILRKSFKIDRKVKRATMYASALGLYEIELNGKRVGDQVLAPEWTDYTKRVQYQTYDVSEVLGDGENTIHATIADGWYAGRIGLAPPPGRRCYGATPALIAQLEIEYDDGSKSTIATDASWECSDAGPIQPADLLDGEVQDLRMEPKEWFQPRVIETKATLVAQMNEPIRVVREVAPKNISEPKPGVFVADFGENVVGVCRLKCQGKSSEVVTLRHGEMLNDDGTLYVANLRGAPQTDRFTLRGDSEEILQARFTYHGFRYAEISGGIAKPQAGDLRALVFYSSSPLVGKFECSDAMLNQLWANIVRTQQGNMHSVPTDCPQRDERLGWMGDIQAFSQTAIFNMDMAGFFTKWLGDVRDAQEPDGRYWEFSPRAFRVEPFKGAVPAWSDAGVIVPWRMYQNYGDVRLLREHYQSAKGWVQFVRKNNPDGIWKNERGADYGDWLNGDRVAKDGWPKTGGEVPKVVLATAFYAHSARLLSKMAEVIGEKNDATEYRQLFEQIRDAFNKNFVKPDGTIEGNTQAGYALALNFELLSEELRTKASAKMVEGLKRYDGHLSTGIQSTHRLMLELSRNGHDNEAWRLLTQHSFPSWGFMIDNGATTIWERWDGYVKGRGFQDAGMNSFNHMAFGSVGEWMYRNVLGINGDDDHPGFKHFIIRPRPGGGVTWARGEYDSIRGKIASEWKIENGTMKLKVTIPPNTSARIEMPDGATSDVGSGDYEFSASIK